MKIRPTHTPWLSRPMALLRASRSGPFQLTRYFTIISLVAFAVLAASLYLLERAEQQFLQVVQQEQTAFFGQVQAQLAREQKEAARGNLLMVHQAGHVTLTNLFANVLWKSRLAPLVANAQSISVDHCRGPGLIATAVAPAGQQQTQQACFSDLGRKIMALPGFVAVDSTVRTMMAKTTVFKIKVYDLRGLTVYSSELSQIGEDKADNAGWKSAVHGRPASEFVHRNRFSAFEGVVENRDLIQSYIPAMAPGGAISGVFEIYSDVTPFLQQIDAGSARVTDVTTRSQARVEQAAIKNQREAAAASSKLLLVVGGLLALVYAALLVFVRNGQRIIDQEARAREQSALGEQRWHRDKMAAMAAMAANISHEVGNPLAIISGLAEDIERWHSASEFNPEPPRMILEQTLRIANMTRRITEFATARSETSEPLDINQLIEDVCAFLGFDGRFRDTPIELRLSDHLSACVGIPDHLTEVLMGLLQAHEEVCKKRQAAGARILVQTQARGKELMVGIWCECSTTRETCSLSSGDSRLESARRRMDAMGGRIELADARLDIYLRSFTSNASGT